MQWGILITANHIEMVLVNLGDEIIKKRSHPFKNLRLNYLIVQRWHKRSKLFWKAK